MRAPKQGKKKREGTIRRNDEERPELLSHPNPANTTTLKGYQCGCDNCSKYVCQKNARYMRKATMVSKSFLKEGKRPNIQHFDCGCERCAAYVRCKNARSMRRAIIVSKRFSQFQQGPACTSSQVLSQKEKKQLKASLVEKNPLMKCPHCEALVWYSERTRNDSNTGEHLYTICCQQGRVKLPPVREPPSLLKKIQDDNLSFRNNIRAYNSMLAFTSIGAKIDHSVTSGNGPPAFRIQGQIYHRIGSLLPMPGQPPKFLQMWIVDTEKEVSNRLSTMARKKTGGELEKEIIMGLINMMDEHNCLSRFFRKARDRYKSNDLQELTIRLIGQRGKGRQFDLPEINEVAGLIVGDLTSTIDHRDVVLELQTNHLQQIRDDHPLFMSLQYPLLFPFGEYGFHTEIPHAITQSGDRKRTYISIREFYAYQIQTRLAEGMTIIKGGRLLQQYVVDAYASIEQERLRWAKNNQDQLRADLYSNVFDAVGKGDAEAKKLGKRFILPSSFTGGPRYMIEKYHDAMAICRTYGNPTLFITMTANPNWREIKKHLSAYGGVSGNDRPDIECRVFKMKLDELIKDLEKGTFFSSYIAVLHTIEFQKRGLPHAHILLWLDKTTKFPTAADINAIISAELPDRKDDPIGFQLVEKHMMHGPCGRDRPTSPCMDNHGCTKKYPRSYTDFTSVDKSGYITYRRRNDSGNFVIKGRTRLDNRFVIPHNIHILKKYEAHINVEWCNTTNAVKYLFKYITKGVDKATILVEKGTSAVTNNRATENVLSERNEIQEYLDCRYLSACEAMWRTFAFHIHKRKPAVQKLNIHLPNQQMVTYRDSDNLGRVLSRGGIEKTMLTEWMKMNKHCEEARELTYVEFPKFFVWENDNKIWHRRKQGTSVGRIVNIHPSAEELYYLRILVNVVKGPTSFDDLLTVNGEKRNNFKAACYARGLLENDSEWHRAMDESALWATPRQLRHLFVTLLIYCEVANPLLLWEHCWKALSEDILNMKRREFGFRRLDLNEEEVGQYTLIEIEKLLHQYERSLTDFKEMPKPDLHILKEIGSSLLQQEYQYNLRKEKEDHDKSYECLNMDQTKVYDAVFNSIDNNLGQLFFLNGSGGTGKTFVYKTIISKLRSTKKVVLPVASSGIAALLLPGGRTAHFRFKIPLNVDEDSVCEIKHGTMLAELLLNTDLIIWDESPMSHRHTFEALDRTLRDLMSISDSSASEKIFGGKTVLLGGDFRQILPVISHGTRTDTVLACISQSYLWNECNVHNLHINMRLQPSETSFAAWLLSVGDGTAKVCPTITTNKDNEGEVVVVDKHFLMEPNGNPLQQITKETYALCNEAETNFEYFTERAILTPHNDTVDEINAYILSQVAGEIKQYLSYDCIEKADTIGVDYETLYPLEYLNSMEFPGLPKHKLILKIGAPIMLLRNINQKEGLCNGTRLIVTQMGERVVEGEIVSGTHVGNKILLPRIILSPTHSDHPFTLKRRQFPIRVCYAMTINKSQGQSQRLVALYLPNAVFSHGQLYVALSRVTSPQGLKIMQEEDQVHNGVTNIVYKEIFNNIPN